MSTQECRTASHLLEAGAIPLDSEAGGRIEPSPLPRLPANGLAPSLERKRLRYYTSLVLGDLIMLPASFAAILAIYLRVPLHRPEMLAAFLLAPIYLTLALYNGTYSLRALTDWKKSSLQMALSLAWQLPCSISSPFSPR